MFRPIHSLPAALLIALLGCSANGGGARSLVEARCGACHRFQGRGARLAPPLDGIVGRRGADYVRRYVRDPRSIDPNSRMKPLSLPPPLLDRLVAELTGRSLEATPAAD